MFFKSLKPHTHASHELMHYVTQHCGEGAASNANRHGHTYDSHTVHRHTVSRNKGWECFCSVFTLSTLWHFCLGMLSKQVENRKKGNEKLAGPSAITEHHSHVGSLGLDCYEWPKQVTQIHHSDAKTQFKGLTGQSRVRCTKLSQQGKSIK